VDHQLIQRTRWRQAARSYIRLLTLLSLTMTGGCTATSGVQPADADRILADFGFGIQFAIQRGSVLRFSASSLNPVYVAFVATADGETETIAVYRGGEHIYDMQDTWIWATIKGTVIDASRNPVMEELLQRLAREQNLAYEIKDPRFVVTEGGLEFSGWALVAGKRVTCTAGGVALSNTVELSREYSVDMAVAWQEDTICSIGEQAFDRKEGRWACSEK